MKKMMLTMCFVGMVVLVSGQRSFATWLDDDFDDGVVDTGEVWESGTTLYHDDANSKYPRPYVRSRADNGYSWTEGTAIIDWDAGGRYTGLFTAGQQYYLALRKDIVGGQWTMAIKDTNGVRNYNLGTGYDPTVGWHWEIEFGGGNVTFRGKKYTDTEWQKNNLYTYNISDPFVLETGSYNTTAEFGRLAVVPEPATIGLILLGFVGLIRRK